MTESIDSWPKDNPLPDDAEHPENYRKAFTGNTWNGGAPDGYYPQKHVDDLLEKIEAMRKALEEARDELVEHKMDYHHQTDRAILARINAALEGQKP